LQQIGEAARGRRHSGLVRFKLPNQLRHEIPSQT
jgi:hypothetical protein